MLRAIREDTLLSNETVQEIINLRAAGIPQRKTAELIGVSLNTVSRIVCGKRLLNVPKVRHSEPAYVQAEPVRCPTSSRDHLFITMTKEEFKVILSELTEAKDRLIRLDFEMRQVRAKLYLEIKQHPARYGLEKATENTIEAIMDISSEVINLENKIIAAKHEQSVCFADYDLAKYEIDTMKNDLLKMESYEQVP